MSNISEITNLCKVGRYEYFTTDIIGRGYYGRVYKGKRSSDDLPVAIKTVDLIEHPEKQEAEFVNNQLKIHQFLKHNRILECIQIYRKGNVFYFVTQLVEEGDLQRYLFQKGPMSEIQALRTLKQIIEGLSYLKYKKVIHRDIKPGNIFIKDGNAKIGDFGLSIFCYQNKLEEELRIGTPRYMPPEVLHEGIYTFKFDIWSLANVFIQMILGYAPLAFCESFQQVTEKVIQPIIPNDLKISNQAMDLLKQMLEIDQSKRISIQQLEIHPIFDLLSKHNSILTNNSEDYLSVQQLSVTSHTLSRISSFSTYNHENFDDITPCLKQNLDQTNSTEKDHSNVEHLKMFQRFSKTILQWNIHYDKFQYLGNCMKQGLKISNLQLEYLINVIKSDSESQIQSLDLIDFKNTLTTQLVQNTSV